MYGKTTMARAPPRTTVCLEPDKRQPGRGIRVIAGQAGQGIAASGPFQESIDIDSLQRGRQQSDNRSDRGPAAHPIPHGEAGKPALLDSQTVQFALFPGYGNSVPRELEPGPFIGKSRLQHSVTGLLRPPALGNHQSQGLSQAVADFRQNPIHSVRIGVVEKKRLHGVIDSTERIGNELGPKGRPSDPDQQKAGKSSPLLRRNLTVMDPCGKVLYRPYRGLDLQRNLFGRSKMRCTQPVVPHHPPFVGIGQGTVLQLRHVPVRLQHEGFHCLKIIVRETHPADIKEQTEFRIAVQIFLIAFPQCLAFHGILSFFR